MSPSSFLYNILRIILFAVVLGIVFGVLTTVKSYAIDSSHVQAVAIEERIMNYYQFQTDKDISEISNDELLTIIGQINTKELAYGDIGVRVTLNSAISDEMIAEVYYNQDFFDKNLIKTSTKSNYIKYNFYRVIQDKSNNIISVKIEVISQVG